jgi:hypothetical protein
MAIPTVPPPGEVIATTYREVIHAHPQEDPLPLPEWDNDSAFASERRQAMPTQRSLVKTLPKANPALAGPALHPPTSVTTPFPMTNQFVGLTDAAAPMMGNWKKTYPNQVSPLPLTAENPELFEPEPMGPRFYLGAEYLLWWTKSDKAPPLVTSGAADPLVLSPGALGNADTRVLQDGSLNRGPHSGLRLTAGWWLDDHAGKAIELSGFFLGSRSSRFDASSAQFPVISRPFFDVVAGREEVQLVSFPGFIAGNVSVRSDSELWGLEANFICPQCITCDYRLNFLFGPRFLSLREGLTVTEDLQLLADIGDFQAGDRVRVTDSFRTRNQFYGAQVGAEARWLFGRWTLDGRAKLAAGVTNQQITIDGNQTFLQGVNPDPRPGGLLATGTNIGNYRRSGFSVVPEVGLSVGYYVNDWTRLSVGYNFLYWTNVARPGGQVDRNLNPFTIPNFDTTGLVNNGANAPTAPLKTSDFWAHGLTFGLEFTF